MVLNSKWNDFLKPAASGILDHKARRQALVWGLASAFFVAVLAPCARQERAVTVLRVRHGCLLRLSPHDSCVRSKNKKSTFFLSLSEQKATRFVVDLPQLFSHIKSENANSALIALSASRLPLKRGRTPPHSLASVPPFRVVLVICRASINAIRCLVRFDVYFSAFLSEPEFLANRAFIGLCARFCTSNSAKTQVQKSL